MKQIKKLSVVLGLVSVFATSPLMAKSGNGDSYSGPTLSGDVVALSLDKPILVEQFQSVFNSCMTKGNFLKDFLDNYYKNKQASYALKGEEGVEESPFRQSHLIIKGAFYATHTYPISIGQDLVKVTINSLGQMEISLVPMMKGNNMSFVVESAPVFSFSKFVSVPVYDPITGEMIKTNKYIKDLKVIYDNAKNPGYVQAINVATKQRTQLMAPVGDFTNCVIEKLGSL